MVTLDSVGSLSRLGDMTKTPEYLYSRLDGKGRVRRSLLAADYSIVKSLPLRISDEGLSWEEVDAMLAHEGLKRVSGAYENIGGQAYRWRVEPV